MVLTNARITALSEPGRYGDGGTLVVAPGGCKSWVQRLTISRKRRDLGLAAGRWQRSPKRANRHSRIAAWRDAARTCAAEVRPAGEVGHKPEAIAIWC